MGKDVYIVKSKNLNPICILRVLEDHSDFRHKLSYNDIIHYLKEDFGIESIDRNSIARTIGRLNVELKCDIESDSHGIWLGEHLFEDSELHILIDGVMGSRYISRKHSEQLIEKLSSLGNEYFRSNIKYTYSLMDLGKTGNTSVFYNIDKIEHAIAGNRRMEFDYNRYGVDKELHVTAHHEVTPYRMFVHNQRYYLMALNEKYGHIVYYRLDRIKKMEVLKDKAGTPIRTIPGWETGISNKKILTSLPYMYADKQCIVTLYVKTDAIDQMIDWLGYDIDIRKVNEESDRVKLTVNTSPKAMKYFALQFLDAVEVIAPASLRTEIAEALKAGMSKYEK